MTDKLLNHKGIGHLTNHSPFSWVILILPLIYLIWSLIASHLAGPFYLSRSDPEYPYLLNGLNCALLQFQNIGHTDHPGTPFQMLTGLFILLTYVMGGEGGLMDDVIRRPETYLSFASLFLAVLTFLVLVWLGRLVMRHSGNLAGVFILQGSVLLSSVLIDFPIRYNPDRVLVLYVLVFAGISYQYIFAKRLTDKHFSLLSGILMGVAFATKFNFLPILIIPVLLVPKWRCWLIYGAGFLLAGFFSILPILGKFSEFRKFISGVATHDGLYGQGSEQMINFQEFFANILLIFKYNPAYTIILALAMVFAILFLAHPAARKIRGKELLFLVSFLLASLVGFVMVAKHFKNYYFAPVLSLAGFVLLILVDRGFSGLPDRLRKVLTLLVPAGLVLLTVIPAISAYGLRAERYRHNQQSADFIRSNCGPNGILFIEPTWLAGPAVENGLVYGISYVAHRHQFYPQYMRTFPHVITWEGEGKPLRHFRTLDADPEALLRSGQTIHILASPGRDAGKLTREIWALGDRYGVTFQTDTAFHNLHTQESVIRLKPNESWKTLRNEVIIGREPRQLDEGTRNSRQVMVQDVREGDYLVVQALVSVKENPLGTLILKSLSPDSDSVYFADSHSFFEVGKDWRLLRLRAHIGNAPEGNRVVTHFYFPGSGSVQIKEFRVQHFGQR